MWVTKLAFNFPANRVLPAQAVNALPPTAVDFPARFIISQLIYQLAWPSLSIHDNDATHVYIDHQFCKDPSVVVQLQVHILCVIDTHVFVWSSMPSHVYNCQSTNINHQ